MLKSILCVAVLSSLGALSASAGVTARGSVNGAGGPSSPQGGIIYDNGVVGTTGLSSQNDMVYPFDSQVADDFTLATGNGLQYSVSGITFRGIYFNSPTGVAPATDNFNVFIYADNGGVPTGGPGDPSATAIFERSLSGVAGVPTGGGGGLEFDWSLNWGSNTFNLAPGTHYWVAVQEVGSFAAQGQWGWEGTGTGGNAVQGFPLLGINYWSPANPTSEQQFQLTGTQIPEPTSALLLITGMGLVGLVARRRAKAK